MFLYPQILLALLLVPALGVGIWWRERERQRQLNALGDAQLIALLTEQVNINRRWWRAILWLATIALLITALARPVWGIAEEIVTAEGVSIMIVMDVSASMDARDITPSRIDRAKLTARTIYEASEDNRVGLILFAGDAFVQFPLTTDVQSALAFLDAASTASITRQGTAIGEALDLAVATLDDRVSSRSIIILMTDGENHEAPPQPVAERAAGEGIIIHTIGFGSLEGTNIPVLDENGEIIRSRTDSAGNAITTRLNETPLIDIAEITDGIYRRASTDGIEVIDLLNAIQQVETAELENRLQIRRIDRYGIFVFLALTLLGTALFLPETTS